MHSLGSREDIGRGLEHYVRGGGRGHAMEKGIGIYCVSLFVSKIQIKL